ncbi:MAG TPA: hypothetical protein VMC85_05980 [Desulfomonilaceae bacterium]|nr:hypothetical protein [Desulfomonilaceae bacterium]
MKIRQIDRQFDLKNIAGLLSGGYESATLRIGTFWLKSDLKGGAFWLKHGAIIGERLRALVHGEKHLAVKGPE